MSNLDQIVNVTVSQQTQAVAQASFSVPLIIGPTTTSWSTTDFVHSYTDPADMLLDGFTTSDPEYKYALIMFQQTLVPTQFYVGHRTTAVAQVDTITPTAVNNTHYIVTIDGTAYDYLSDGSATVNEIVAGLIALINADSNAPCVATGTTTLILTAKAAGAGFSATINANMVLVHTTPNNGIADDLNNIRLKNDLWYGVVLCSNVEDDILQLANAIESLKKIYIAASSDSAIGTSSTTDVGSKLKSKSYKRTGLIFSPASANDGIDAGWVGGQLPFTPGANNWAIKSVNGVDSDALTPTQASICIGNPAAQITGKNVNIYQVVGGVPIMEMGTMAGGQFIDITVGIDWLESTVQTNVFAAMVNNAKIPYTDQGVGILISAVQAAIDQGIANGLIDGKSPYGVSATPVLQVPANQRAGRVAPTIKAFCRLAGAVNAVNVNITVTV